MSESNESARFNTPDMENGRVAPNGHGAKPVNTPVSGGALAGYPSLVDEEGLSLVELLGMLRQEWRLIAAVFLLVVLAVAAYTFTREPVYQASSVVLVDTNGRRSSGGPRSKTFSPSEGPTGPSTTRSRFCGSRSRWRSAWGHGFSRKIPQAPRWSGA